jgi:hypothetical protein
MPEKGFWHAEDQRLPAGTRCDHFCMIPARVRDGITAQDDGVSFGRLAPRQMRKKILRRYIQSRISQYTDRTANPCTNGSTPLPKILNASLPR